jgi:hypothetical protein
MELRVAHAVLAFALALPAFSSSCAFALPRETCNAKDVTALLSGTDVDPACKACLEDQCCDDVGYCVKDEAASCAARVKETHACVLGAGLRGALEERACKAHLGDSHHAQSLYACMRGHCGPDCKLPVCQLNPAALQFGAPSCDRCVTSSCCEQVNACYGSRTCKLALECIVKNCGRDLADDFKRAKTVDLGIIQQQACTSGPPDGATVSDGGDQIIGPCVRDCLVAYASTSADGVDDPTTEAGCLAFNVFACGARADCAADCAVATDAGSDAKDAPSD